jgi:hypothetical protein
MHDSQDEDDEEAEETTVGPEPHTASEPENEEPAPSEAESTPAPSLLPATRTRKAKDTQTRLGKGRPVIAGGTGARAVTKSVSVSRGSNRGKGSRTGVKLAQETIIEEGEIFDQMWVSDLNWLHYDRSRAITCRPFST